MLILFTEQDLVSFGNYMVSPERAKPYLENEIIKDEVNKYLTQVNKFDLDTWLRIRQQEEVAMMKPREEKPQTIDEVPVEEEEKAFTDDSITL